MTIAIAIANSAPLMLSLWCIDKVGYKIPCETAGENVHMHVQWISSALEFPSLSVSRSVFP